jgi:hypothetical protein
MQAGMECGEARRKARKRVMNGGKKTYESTAPY